MKLLGLVLLGLTAMAQEEPRVCSPFEKGIAYKGFNLANTTRSSAGECCEDCKSTPGCTIFVYYKKLCKLKTNAGEAKRVRGAISSFVVPETPEPSEDPTPEDPTPTPDNCGCDGGDLCSEDGRCSACNMRTSAGRMCQDRFFSTCRWYGHSWCGEPPAPTPAPPANVGRCDCQAGHKCDVDIGKCKFCNYPKLSTPDGLTGVCEDWEKNACAHTFGGQWCG